MPVVIDAIAYRASADITQPWNDIDARLELGFNEAINAVQTVQMVDVLGQVVATGRPIEPSIAESRTSYALQSLLSRMDTEAILSRNLVIEGPLTPKTFLEGLLNAAKEDYQWLEWEPIPVIGLLVRDAAALNLVVDSATDAPVVFGEWSPGGYVVYELVLAALSAPRWYGVQIEGRWEKTASMVNTKNVVSGAARFIPSSPTLPAQTVTATVESGLVPAYAFRLALTSPTLP